MSLQRMMEGETLVLLSEDDVVLQLNEKIENDQVRIELCGSMRSDAAQDLEDELMVFILAGMSITLFMDKVTYLSASCIQVLIRLQKKIDHLRKGSMKISKLPAALLSEMNKTGAGELLDIEE